MPFTVSLGNDRGRNGLAPCSPFVEKGFWDQQPWELRKEYCRVCIYRFTYRPTCNMDFLTVGETDKFKSELAIALGYMTEDPGWDLMDCCIPEVELVYYYIGTALPSPREVLSEFMGCCMEVKPNEDFWKEWNYRWVEHKAGKPALRVTIPGPVKVDVDRITYNLIEPTKYSGTRLLLMYAAVAILEDVSIYLGLATLHGACSNLVEACRRAVMANSSIEIT